MWPVDFDSLTWQPGSIRIILVFPCQNNLQIVAKKSFLFIIHTSELCEWPFAVQKILFIATTPDTVEERALEGLLSGHSGPEMTFMS